MGLSKEQEEKMYDNTLTACESISWIKERLEKGDETLGDHAKRLRSLESNQKLLNGKLGWIVLGMSICFTAALHAVGWIVSHIWK